MKAFISFFFAACTFCTSAQVIVHVNDEIKIFSSPPDIVTVLKTEALKQEWYWPAASLFRLDNAKVEQKRLAILAKLRELKRDVPSGADTIVTNLEYYIASWTLAERVDAYLDYDLVRFHKEYNRTFDEGEYKLMLRTRPENISVMGALDMSVLLAHQGGNDTAFYINQTRPGMLADLDFIFIIQPDGEVKRVGIQSWNYEFVEPAPGSTLFIPFTDGLTFNRFEQLNQDIADLVRHRVK